MATALSNGVSTMYSAPNPASFTGVASGTDAGSNAVQLPPAATGQDGAQGTKRPYEGQGGEDGKGEGSDKKWPGYPGESVFRMVVPVHKVGSIIGPKGEFVRKMSEETKARIKVLEGVQGTSERVVMISGKENREATLPPAVAGVLRIHRQLVEGVDVDSTVLPSSELVGTVTAKFLLPGTQAGNLIGRSGVTIQSIQEQSGAAIHVAPENEVPPYAMMDDRVVEVTGPALAVYKALELVLQQLRKFLVDRTVLPLFERKLERGGGAQLADGPPSRPPPYGMEPDYAPDTRPSWGPGPAMAPPLGQRGYGNGAAMDNFYGGPVPAGAPMRGGGMPPYGAPQQQQQQPMQQQQQLQQQPLQQQPLQQMHFQQQQPPPQQQQQQLGPGGDFSGQQRVISLYGRDPNISRPTAPAFPPAPAQAMAGNPMVSVKEVSASLQIPLALADAVIGVNGQNIVYLRRVSGAMVSVQESRGAGGLAEMGVEIRGTTQQVQQAEQLLQSFIQSYTPTAHHNDPVSAPSGGVGGAPPSAMGGAAAGQLSAPSYGYNAPPAADPYAASYPTSAPAQQFQTQQYGGGAPLGGGAAQYAAAPAGGMGGGMGLAGGSMVAAAQASGGYDQSAGADAYYGRQQQQVQQAQYGAVAQAGAGGHEAQYGAPYNY